MRGLIIWGIGIALVAALATPQRACGGETTSTNSDAATQPSSTPVDPVILEPIRPLLPDGVDTVPMARGCGSPEVLMMLPVAWFLLTLNVASDKRARRGT